jgi:aspartate racemase
MVKMLGILGGMGPLATVDFFNKVISLTPATQDQEHIPIIVRSLPQIPSRTDAITGHGLSPQTQLIDGARQLVLSGAQVIAMPCNTAHAWWAPICAGVPGTLVLHIVEAALQALAIHAPHATRIGLLATDGTHKAGVYTKHASANARHAALTWLMPREEAQQRWVMRGIQAVKANQLELGEALLTQAVHQLRDEGAHAVVAACTEVPIALKMGLRDEPFDVPVIDASLALAQLAVDTCFDGELSCPPMGMESAVNV